ncbi:MULTISPECIES: 3-isopropylmalate dehydrogenase [unclassified Novosphingobium]|uniref:3-isopropylmalate dehydrogenase n=1 Tax=unclassified Novosphingobium TaxID=2644732 RepID=UPI0003B63512|nr:MULTISPECIES: 3-isopropylmalate dehydrogenase [unclassified Novosphingobium]KPF56730.1 3-isopropylmalate dehydrogenase [Novosphingobium sp. AAP1]PTR12439.1 3-isopropylmalate dehydrogenase [Novosphingobium sp. GV055]PUB05840.1 3-isopropylmalate dehydrogenase [Novosphingobium sp. GV061]PUB22073.1 3-isopropylmalate dehydrogenase [Novosphingobium sp. GV079]PUB43846.1 3-isopropylmalate dehydrogenase [Novosphingobium sp. GV027]
MKIAVLPGDGIGPEVTREAVRVIEALDLGIAMDEALVGGCAYKAKGHPLPAETLDLARASDAILFGAVGDPDCDALERHLRPEQAILGLRKELTLFANLRPAKVFAGLESHSALRPEVAGAIDLLIVRELNGDVYFGEKGFRQNAKGEREGYDIMSYSESEVRRIAHVAFRAAMGRGKRLCSVDKANVLETSQLWRDVIVDVAKDYPQVELEHMYVDNAAMQLVRAPGKFDVVVTGNLFGDILSDQASMCVGSIGLLASASLGERQTAHGTFGLYEPIHGSAPDIAGKGLANPMATILSAAMLLRHSLGLAQAADRIEAAVAAVLADGVLGGDLGGTAGTAEIGDAVLAKL